MTAYKISLHYFDMVRYCIRYDRRAVIPWIRGLLFWVLYLSVQVARAQCGMDIFIANDQSGSVDAWENAKSRSFITTLASSLDLGNKDDQVRVAIADWDSQNNWVQYKFPDAGKSYTTLLSDVIAYQNADRIMGGGTDVLMALRNTYEMIINNPDRRAVPEMIILMTDVNCSARAEILELSAQIMAEGIFIAVFAIDAAYNCPFLRDVASPGGYFDAYNYDDLELFAVEYTNNLIGVACSDVKFVYDFSIKLDEFNAVNCFPGPGTYKVNYIIENRGMEDFAGELMISFYDDDPSLPSAKLIGVQSTGSINLPKGEKFSGTYTGEELKYFETAYAIVNFDGRLPGRNVPLYPQLLHPLLIFEGERTAFNNISNGLIRDNGAGCIPTATLQIHVQADGVGCGGLVTYTASICNTGNADGIVSNTLPVADENFVLVRSETAVDSTKSTHWATYYGGNVHDYIYAAAMDKWGNIYLLGQTNSTVGISSLSAHQPYPAGMEDAFLVKMNSQGKRLWATYFGGVGTEDGFYVTTDNDGNVIITGQTQNSTNLFTSGAHQSINNGMIDAYMAKFSPSGSLLWSTYYGGSGIDKGKAVYTDTENNIYLLGDTESPDNIATPGVHQENLSGTSDAFLVKFDKNGQRIWGTYVGGTGLETGFGIVSDKKDFIYITGLTGSTTGIATPGSAQVNKGTGNDAYLIKFDKNGQQIWGSYLGGNGNDSGTGLALDSNGDVYISGNTGSTTGMGTAGAHQTILGGGTDAFLSKFTSGGQKVWTTCYGGAATDNGRFVSVDQQNNVYLTGYSLSTDKIATADALQPASAGGADAFIAKFNSSGQRDWGTYFGGPANDYGLSVLADPLGKLYLAGATQSNTGVATEKTYQPVYGGGPNDGYLMKIDEDYSFVLKAGECVSLRYYYSTANAPQGDYDFSFLIEAEKINSSDGEPNILPDMAFDIPGYTNVNGYSGPDHGEDNITVPGTATPCPAGDQVSVELHLESHTACQVSDAPLAAEITIHNTSGVNIRQLNMVLDLSGTGAFFDSELYQLTNGLSVARANNFHPAYPNVPYAIYQKQGVVEIPIHILPPGTSTFKVNIYPGTATAQFQVYISDIPGIYNPSGISNTASDAQGITVLPAPEILQWICPAAVNSDQSIQLTGISTSNTHQVFWNSATAGSLSNNGTVLQPALQYTLHPLDIARGYADLSLQVQNNSGCTDQKFCRVVINNVVLDYGDAPKSYDLEHTQRPVAAGSTISQEIFLGKISPGAETSAKFSQYAEGDGVEEDGLLKQCFIQPVPNTLYIIKVGATNLSGNKAYLNGFMDWNQSGNWIDTLARAQSILAIPSSSGYQEYDLKFRVPSDAKVNAAGFFLRLRISTDAAAVRSSFGPSPEGEVEDHYIKMNERDSIRLKQEICSGDSVIVGNNTYKVSGIYKDVLQNQHGCDSIVVTDLTVKAAQTVNQSVSICSGSSYTIGNHTYTSSGIYRDTLQSYQGCDSIVVTDLTVSNKIEAHQSVEICSGSGYTIGNHTYTSSGIYRDTLQGYQGCDSIVVTNLTIKAVQTVNQSVSICSGSSYTIGNHTYTSIGIYRDTLQSFQGCDSIVITDLKVSNKTEAHQSVEICSGPGYTIGNHTYTSSGIYRDTLQSNQGCDSIVVTDLQVYKEIIAEQTVGICKGESYQVADNEYTEPGIYRDIFSAYNGCDSILLTTIVWKEDCPGEQSCLVVFPNAFTPNGDGRNDLFRPVLKCELTDFRLEVYNRWGEMIFTTSDAQNGWNGYFNGSLQPQDAYLYLAMYKQYGKEEGYYLKGVVVLLP